MNAGGTSWAEWSETAFGTPYEVWHDGLDINRAAAAYSEDPGLVERMVLEGIAADDALAPKVVDVLARRGHVLPELIEALRATHDAGNWDFAISSALALHAATAEEAWDAIPLRALREAPSWTFRNDAAIALRDFSPTAARIEALAAGLTDPEYLVRYHCGMTLLRYGGDESEISDLPVFQDILDEPAADASERHARAAKLLAAQASASLP